MFVDKNNQGNSILCRYLYVFHHVVFWLSKTLVVQLTIAPIIQDSAGEKNNLIMENLEKGFLVILSPFHHFLYPATLFSFRGFQSMTL